MSFQWSFEEPNPFLGWDASAPLVAGRHDFGAQLDALSSNLGRDYTTETHFGVAYTTQTYGNSVIKLSGDADTQSLLEHVGNGRLQVRIVGYGVTKTVIVPKAVMRQNRYNFFELYSKIDGIVITPIGGGQSNVVLTVDYAVQFNNELLIVDQYSSGVVTLNDPVTLATLEHVQFGAPGGGSHCVVDDIYFDTFFRGDGRAYYDAGASGTFWSTDVAVPVLPQQLVEVGRMPVAPDNALVTPQQLVEVGLLRPPCPPPYYYKSSTRPGNG